MWKIESSSLDLSIYLFKLHAFIFFCALIHDLSLKYEPFLAAEAFPKWLNPFEKQDLIITIVFAAQLTNDVMGVPSNLFNA